MPLPGDTRYASVMIKTFRGKAAAMVFVGEVPKGFPSQIAHLARRKLVALGVAKRLDDLRQPPENRREALVGDRAGQHSVRINTSDVCASFGAMRAHMTSRSWTTIRRL